MPITWDRVIILSRAQATGFMHICYSAMTVDSQSISLFDANFVQKIRMQLIFSNGAGYQAKD